MDSFTWLQIKRMELALYILEDMERERHQDKLVKSINAIRNEINQLKKQQHGGQTEMEP